MHAQTRCWRLSRAHRDAEMKMKARSPTLVLQ
jgi:hypothetical protein